MSSNLYQRFRETAARQPRHAAILGPRSAAGLSSGELLAAIDATGQQLQAAGVRPGACVGLHANSSAQYIIDTYAIWWCGGCVVPIPPELSLREKAEICGAIALDYVLTPPAGAGFLENFRRGEATQLGERELVPLTPAREHPLGFRELDAAFIRFTSGTTGFSKGVVLSHTTIGERIAGA